MELDGVEESRFLHLLKPIRELAANWNIDIAAELTEYIEELDDIRINFEGADGNLNFAEAALVIQGSALVYSKKVEYLYQLVFAVLDRICDGKPEAGASGAAQDPRKNRRKSTSALAGAAEEKKELFLLLDDVIPVGKNISLKHETLEDTQGLRERIPFALVAGRATTTETSGAFKMTSCDIDASGAFMLERLDTRRQRELLSSARGGSPSRAKDVRFDGDAASERSEQDEELLFGDDGSTGSVGDHNEGLQLFDSPSRTEADGDEHAERHGAERGQTAPLTRAKAQDDQDDSSVEGEDSTDPWARLDPHEHGDPRLADPLRRAKTWQVPKALKSDPASRAAAARELHGSNLVVSVAVVPSIAAKLPARAGVVLYPEFRAYAAERRRRARKLKAVERKKARLLRQPAGASGGLDEEERWREDAEDAEERIAAQVAAGADDAESDADEEFYYDGGDFAGAGSDGEDADLGDRRINLSEAAFREAPDTYVDMVRAHLQQYLESANQWATESRLHARVRKWEERIEPFLAEQTRRPPFDIHVYGSRILGGLSAAAEDGDEESTVDLPKGTISFEELSARLASLRTSSGHERMDAEGNLAESDGEDEPEASEGMLGASSADEQRPLDQFEVCRVFLASLQLANNGNVELVHEDNDSQLCVRLLDTVLANEKLGGGLAPALDSAATKGGAADGSRAKKRAKRDRRKVEDPEEVENIAV